MSDLDFQVTIEESPQGQSVTVTAPIGVKKQVWKYADLLEGCFRFYHLNSTQFELRYAVGYPPQTPAAIATAAAYFAGNPDWKQTIRELATAVRRSTTQVKLVLLEEKKLDNELLMRIFRLMLQKLVAQELNAQLEKLSQEGFPVTILYDRYRRAVEAKKRLEFPTSTPTISNEEIRQRLELCESNIELLKQLYEQAKGYNLQIRTFYTESHALVRETINLFERNDGTYTILMQTLQDIAELRRKILAIGADERDTILPSADALLEEVNSITPPEPRKS